MSEDAGDRARREVERQYQISQEYAARKASEEAWKAANPDPVGLGGWLLFILLFLAVLCVVVLFVANPWLLSWWGPWCWWVISAGFGLFLLFKTAQGVVWAIQHPVKFLVSLGSIVGLFVLILYGLGFFNKTSTQPAPSVDSQSAKPSPRSAPPKSRKRRQLPSASAPVKAKPVEAVTESQP